MNAREKLCMMLGHQQLALIEQEAEIERLRQELEVAKAPAQDAVAPEGDEQ